MSTFLVCLSFEILHDVCFQETELPEREASKREHGSEPYPSPTHAGGLFAINRDYFLTLGAYDPGELDFVNGSQQKRKLFTIN